MEGYVCTVGSQPECILHRMYQSPQGHDSIYKPVTCESRSYKVMCKVTVPRMTGSVTWRSINGIN